MIKKQCNVLIALPVFEFHLEHGGDIQNFLDLRQRSTGHDQLHGARSHLSQRNKRPEETVYLVAVKLIWCISHAARLFHGLEHI